jgi:hypothetical protein
MFAVCRRLDVRRSSMPTDVILDVGARSRLFLSHHLGAMAVHAKPGRSDRCWRFFGIERRFEKARGGRGPSSPNPPIVVCRKD